MRERKRIEKIKLKKLKRGHIRSEHTKNMRNSDGK